MILHPEFRGGRSIKPVDTLVCPWIPKLDHKRITLLTNFRRVFLFKIKCNLLILYFLMRDYYFLKNFCVNWICLNSVCEKKNITRNFHPVYLYGVFLSASPNRVHGKWRSYSSIHMRIRCTLHTLNKWFTLHADDQNLNLHILNHSVFKTILLIKWYAELFEYLW